MWLSFTPSGVLHPTRSPFLLKQALFEQHFDTLIYLRSSWCRCISPACNSRISFHKVFRLWAFHLDLLHGRQEGDYFLSPCARVRVAVGCLVGGLPFDQKPPSGIKIKCINFKEQSRVGVQSPGRETAPTGRFHSAHPEKYFPSRFGGISRLLFPIVPGAVRTRSQSVVNRYWPPSWPQTLISIISVWINSSFSCLALFTFFFLPLSPTNSMLFCLKWRDLRSALTWTWSKCKEVSYRDSHGGFFPFFKD